ncbi:phosphoribosylglycinamide formyltransferase [Rhabdaerophilum calidifontis]|uniref:phosphoribosylglycinamide formyltransferase n=1 Tax=Rhabdaerophilum calidifontis TaxID=2604328 RepID=UPI001FEB5E48
MAALIAAARAADFPAEIALVLSNRPEAGGLAIAAAAGIATACIDHRPFGKDRAAFDAAMQAELERRGVEIVCLAGFMRLLTPDFCAAWAGRMINIHPALLPSFKGLDTHTRALAAGVKLHGCTTHFVTPGMDEGPIIAQAAVPVLDDDSEASLSARVLAEEHRLYPETLRLLAAGRLRIEGNRVIRLPA